MSEKAVNFRFGGNSEDLEKMLGRVESGFDHLEKIAKTVEGAFAFEKIKESFLDFIKESDDATLAQQKFAVTLQSTGKAGDPGEMQELAEALSMVTNFSAEATVGAASMLARFKIGQEQIQEMIPSVQDLASYMGTDLVNASDSVGRAVAIGSQGLRALRLNFDTGARAAFDMADSQGRVDMIMQRINGTMGGFAKVAGSTTTAAVGQLGEAMKHLRESVGGVLEQPVGVAIHGITNAVVAAKQAFDGMSPAARGTVVALGAGVAIAAALAAGFAAVSGALALAAPLLGPIGAGLAFVAGSELSLAGATAGLSASFAGLGATAATAWSVILLPALAVGGAIVGLIAGVGAFRDLWISSGTEIKTAIKGVAEGIVEGFGKAFNWLAETWASIINAVIEKFTLVKGMLSGLSPDEAGAKAREAVNSSGGAAALAKIKEAMAEVGASISGAGGTAMAYLSTGADMVKDGVGYAASGLKQSLGSGADALKGLLASLGIDLDKILGGGKKTVGPVAAGKTTKDHDESPVTLKEMFLGVTDKAMKAADANIAAAMERAFGGGSRGMMAASRFLNQLEITSGLSEATLTTILARTKTSVAQVGGVATALAGVSDGVVQSLLKASGYNIEAVTAVAPALKGVSDGAVQAILKASGGSLTALAAVAPHVRLMSDDTINTFLRLGGSLNGLSQMGDDFRAQGPIMASAVAATDTYWHSFEGQMQLLKADAAGVAAGIASSMGAAGGAFSNVMGALSHGDLMGAVISGITSIVTQSKAFQAVSNIINQMFTNFSQALNPLFDGLAPILMLVGSLLSSIGGAIQAIFSGIQPLFALISGVLAPIFTVVNSVFGGLKSVFQAIFAPIMPIVKSLMPIFKIIGDLFSAIAPILVQLFVKTSPLTIILGLVTALFTALEPVFKIVSESIGKFINFVLSVFKGLAGIWNNIVNFVADVVERFVSIIPGMADAAKSFAKSIRGAEVNVGDLSAAMAKVTTDASTQADVTFPKLENSIDGASGAAREMGNMPQGYKVALDEFNAATALSVQGMQDFQTLTSGNLGSPNPSSVPTVTVGSLPSVSSSASSSAPQTAGGAGSTVNMYVTAADPVALAAAVQIQIAKQNIAATGNPNTGGAGKFTTPPTSASYK